MAASDGEQSLSSSHTPIELIQMEVIWAHIVFWSWRRAACADQS